MVGLLAWRLSEPVRRSDLIIAIGGGILGITAYNALFNTGQTLVSPSVAGFAVGIQPLFAALLAAIFLRERVSPRQWLGIAIGICGLLIIPYARSDADGSVIGVAIITAAAICSAASFVIQRPAIGRLRLFVLMLIVILSGAVALSRWLADGIDEAKHATPSAIWALGYLAFGAGFLGYLTWAHTLRIFGAAKAASYLFLMAPVAALLDTLITNAIPPIGVLMGGTIATFGVAVGTVRTRQSVLNRRASV